MDVLSLIEIDDLRIDDLRIDELYSEFCEIKYINDDMKTKNIKINEQIN